MTLAARPRRRCLAIFALCLLPAAARGAPFVVATSVAPHAWLVERLGGDRVMARSLIPAGTATETFELRPADMRDLERATAYVRVGHPNFVFEERFIRPWLETHRGVRDIDAGHGLIRPDDPLAGDPHLWVAPASMRRAAHNVASGLADLDPEGADAYRAALAALDADIDDLEAELRALLANVPRDCPLLVYHPAWGHLADQFGLTMLEIEEHGHEPTPRRLAAIIGRACPGHGDVFIQPGFAAAAAAAVATELGGRLRVIDPLERDWPQGLRRTAAAFRDALAP